MELEMRRTLLRAVISTIVMFGMGEQVTGHTLISPDVLVARYIKIGSEYGTGFTIEFEGRSYLITAKHIFSHGAGNQRDVDVCRSFTDCTRMNLEVLRCPDPNDIAVLPLPARIPNSPTVAVSAEMPVIGQDVYFLGFPFELFATELDPPNPMVPFIRRATMAGVMEVHGSTQLLLDGINNSGFSGGPIIFRDPNANGGPFKIAGVISGFKTDYQKVWNTNAVNSAQVTRETLLAEQVFPMGGGQWAGTGAATSDIVKSNSGIVIGYSISAAMDLIRARHAAH